MPIRSRALSEADGDDGDDGDDSDDSNLSEQNQRSRKNRLSLSLVLGRRKKRKSDVLDPYRKFVAFYTRSQNPFVNYYSVLDAGMAWETNQFGDLTRDEFRAENAKLLHVYRRLRSAVPQFTRDFYELRQAPEELESLQKQLNDVVTSARGADIHSLREKGISYIELEQPDKQIVPRIDSATPKSSVRGHKHPVLSRLLCPVKYLEADFDVNPAEFQNKLRNNKVRVTAGDFPALLYAYGCYDPDDPESGLFRNPILVRFYKHIFTAPSSARQELTLSSNKPKIKRPQAVLNNMTAVTPGSIAYAALMFRHCVSSLDDWRTEDDLFNREEFFDFMVSLLDDPEDEWVNDTLKWWNNLVFGTLYDASDDGQKREPSTVDLLRISRAARKTKAQQPIRERTPAPSFSSSLHPQVPGRERPPSPSTQTAIVSRVNDQGRLTETHPQEARELSPSSTGRTTISRRGNRLHSDTQASESNRYANRSPNPSQRQHWSTPPRIVQQYRDIGSSQSHHPEPNLHPLQDSNVPHRRNHGRDSRSPLPTSARDRSQSPRHHRTNQSLVRHRQDSNSTYRHDPESHWPTHDRR